MDNTIKVYRAVEQIRNFIWFYNKKYFRKDIEGSEQKLISYLQSFYEIVINDYQYWKKMGVDLNVLSEIIKKLEAAVKFKDFVFIYDCLNIDIGRMIFEILNILFYNKKEELCKWFWKENSEALKQRYLSILKQLETIVQNDSVYVRDYGIRGRVVYREDNGREYDLYGAYNPVETGLQMVQKLYLENYDYIYIWKFSGGFEVKSILDIKEKIKIDIYVPDLYEFKVIMKNTLRKGILLDQRLNWVFEQNLRNFLHSIDLRKRDKIFIYVSGCSNEEYATLNKFIIKNDLDSNLKLTEE